MTFPPFQPCKAPCNGLFKGILSAKFMTSKKLNRNTMEQINNGSVRNRKKNVSICFLSSSMCCKHAATQFKTANLGAFLLKKMIENASAGHIQEHGLKGTCCLAVYTGSKVAFLVFPFQVLPLIAVRIHPRSLVIDLQGTDFHMAMIFTTSA